jgi:hypothetical protein
MYKVIRESENIILLVDQKLCSAGSIISYTRIDTDKWVKTPTMMREDRATFDSMYVRKMDADEISWAKKHYIPKAQR